MRQEISIPITVPRLIGLTRLAAVLSVLVLLMVTQAVAQSIPMRLTGESTSRVDILILGDGYLDSDATRFDHDAFRFYDELITNEPFRTYEHFLNVRRIFTLEQQPGRKQDRRTW